MSHFAKILLETTALCCCTRAHTQKKALCNNAREKDDDERTISFFLSFFPRLSVCLSVLSVLCVERDDDPKSDWKKVNARRKREI